VGLVHALDIINMGDCGKYTSFICPKIVKEGLDVFLKPSDITILFLRGAGGSGHLSCLCFWQMLIRMVSILFVCLGN